MCVASSWHPGEALVGVVVDQGMETVRCSRGQRVLGDRIELLFELSV
jgi:hypothetical protein